MSDLNATTIEATSKDTPPKVTVRLNGEGGNIIAGGNGQDGDMMLFGASATGDKLHDAGQANIHIDGKSSIVRVGGTTGSTGFLSVQGAAPFASSRIDLGGSGGAQVKLTPSPFDATAPTTSVHLDGETGSINLRAVTREGTESGANLQLFDGKGTLRIHLDGHTGNMSLTGDIFLTGADCAEEFVVRENDAIEPGTVVVIQEGDLLGASRSPYDKRVAGVVSGAGTCRPGIVLNRQEPTEERRPVALVGRAYCKVDAQYSAIEVGDLLTTSPTVGHAMKASDPLRAFGAVIGKALRPLKEGQGLIPILIAMQ